MIPKIIHCCWLSGELKSQLALRCRASWRKFAPDYEIREWNLSAISTPSALSSFCAEAIRCRKWAFAADWVRFFALEREGGLYLDYDFELVAPIDDLMAGGAFVAGQWMPNGSVGMEPAVLALEKGSPIAAAMLKYYETASFDGKTTVGEILEGLVNSGGLGDAGRMLRILPPEIMSPIGIDGRMRRTEKTVGIHWYAMSWASPSRRIAKWLSWHGLRNVIEWALRAKAWVKKGGKQRGSGLLTA